MATELNLNMRSDGYVKVEDLLKLNMKTFANIPLRSHTVDDIKEVVFLTAFLVFVHYWILRIVSYFDWKFPEFSIIAAYNFCS